MIRDDFVSNSSSCSFIIHLDTEESLETFKQIYMDIINKYNSEIRISGSRSHSLNCIDNIDVGDEVEIYAGEDDEPTMVRFNLLQNFIEQFNFNVYCDPYAHQTFGKWKKCDYDD